MSSALLSAPEWMTVSETGLITWRPQGAGGYFFEIDSNSGQVLEGFNSGDVGEHHIAIAATDLAGQSAVQQYTLVVDAGSVRFESMPPLTVGVGQTWRYTPVLSGLSEPLTGYLGVDGPPGLSATVLGQILGNLLQPPFTWTPKADQVGLHSIGGT